MEKSSNAGNKRVERIKIILERENIKQIDLADALDILPQNFSRFMVSGKVSEKTCRKIVALYPDYRIEWLLGYDDSMTDHDYIENAQRLNDLAANGMWAIIERSLKKHGLSLRFVHRQGQHVNSTQRRKSDCYYSIVDREGNEIKRMTALEMMKFEMQIQEYCDFMTEKHLLK